MIRIEPWGDTFPLAKDEEVVIEIEHDELSYDIETDMINDEVIICINSIGNYTRLIRSYLFEELKERKTGAYGIPLKDNESDK